MVAERDPYAPVPPTASRWAITLSTASIASATASRLALRATSGFWRMTGWVEGTGGPVSGPQWWLDLPPVLPPLRRPSRRWSRSRHPGAPFLTCWNG